MTSFHGRGLNIANDTQIIGLRDGYVQFNLTDLVLDFDLGYEFITDPPIMADLGFLNLTMKDFDLFFNLSSSYVDYNLTLNVTKVHASIEQFSLFFDGLNDFLYVANGILGKIFSVAAIRTKKIVEE